MLFKMIDREAAVNRKLRAPLWFSVLLNFVTYARKYA